MSDKKEVVNIGSIAIHLDGKIILHEKIHEDEANRYDVDCEEWSKLIAKQNLLISLMKRITGSKRVQLHRKK